MASGTISTKHSVTGGINTHTAVGAVSNSGGVTDHSRLINRGASNQHPISAIAGLEEELNKKLDAVSVVPVLNQAIKEKGAGLYYDLNKEFDIKPYWYVTSKIDPTTGQGLKEFIIAGPYDLGQGGGGPGGSSITDLRVLNIDPTTGVALWPETISLESDCILTTYWSSTRGNQPTGNGTVSIYINDTLVINKVQPQGYVSFNITEWLISGTNKIEVRAVDNYSNINTLVGNINAVSLNLTSKFNSKLPLTGAITYTYIPNGDVDKVVYFYIDGELFSTQTVKTTGEQQTLRIPSLSHGAHSLSVYFESEISQALVRSNTLEYQLLYYTADETTPIIASEFNQLEQEQYINFTIPYRVYTPGLNNSVVELFVNDEIIKTLTVDQTEQFWEYKNNVPGTYTLKIKTGEVFKEFSVHIGESTIKIEPVKVDLALALNAQGRTNTEPENQRAVWEYIAEDTAYSNISCELNNFNWSSNGWLKDSAGNTVLRISGDARVVIPYKPFARDFKTSGKTIELEISTSAVRNYSSTIISCLDGSSTAFYAATPSFVDRDTRQKGFTVAVNTSKLGQQGLTLGNHVLNYTTEGWILDNDNTHIIDLSDFGIDLAESILNIDGTGEDYIYLGDNIIVEYSLQARGFYITPQLAVFRSQLSTISSQYKEDEHVRIAFVIEKATDNRIIWLYINGIASGACRYPINDTFNQLDAGFIELGSNDAILDIYNIRIYDNGLTSKQVVNNWIADTQDVATKVERFDRNNLYNDKNEIVTSKLPVDLPYIVWDIDPLPQYKGDKRLGNVQYVEPLNQLRNFTSKNATYNVQGTSSAVYPTKNIRIKYKKNKDYPSQEFNWLDTEDNTISKFSITPNGIGDNYFTYKVDFASSEGANNVELTKLYNDASKANEIYTPPQRLDAKVRVGIDGYPIVAFHKDSEGKLKFRTKANFNNDKANEGVYGFAEGDESWEITNNSADEAKFKVPVTEENLAKAFEIRFPDEDGYNNVSKIGPMTTWVASTNREAATNALLPNPVTFSFKETVMAEDGSSSIISVTKTFDTDSVDYRLAKFKAELANWFNVESTLFYYIFTLCFLMIDSRAKNAFPTYFASRMAGDGGDRWFWLPYDMDTAIGIDNKGKLTFDYYLEDFDQLDGANVYNGQDSVMWTNVRDAFKGEIAAMYANLRTQRKLDYNYVENLFEQHQSKWPENIFNEDSQIKYIAPLANGSDYLEMLQGGKIEQRKWWLYNRFKYLDSKYNAGDAKADFIQFRAYVSSGEQKPNITITPYADIYATVSFANSKDSIKSKRAKRNEPIIIENPFKLEETETDQETYIYSASQLKSIGDISGFKPDTVQISNAVKLQELKVGDASPDYSNPHLTSLSVGNNNLLRSIDVRNCINLTQAIDLRGCTNIEEVYFDGTKVTGVLLPEGGILKKLHLPDTITDLTIKNQPLLDDLQLAGIENIESLWLENIPSSVIDAKSFINQITAGKIVRLIGMNLDFASAQEITNFYDKLDTLKGRNAFGEDASITESVTGIINIPEIAYQNYVELAERYKGIEIKATRIICSVKFYSEGNLLTVKSVVSGSAATYDLSLPEKASTAQYTYTFSHWDKLFNLITTDLEINAVYEENIRRYTIEFLTSSDKIPAPEAQTVDYGQCIINPYTEESVTELLEGLELFNVSFLGWYTPQGELFDFDRPIVDELTLHAKWEDALAPTVILTREKYNEFTYNCTDNVGIIAYAVGDSDTVPAQNEWIPIESTTNLNGNYQINRAGAFYFYIKDDYGNISYDWITAVPVNTTMSSGADLVLRESLGNGFFGEIIQNYALIGTSFVATASIDEHYKDLKFYKNEELLNVNPLEDTIIAALDLRVECTPRNYLVTFNTDYLGQPLGRPIEPIEVTYGHLIEAPFPQFAEQKIIDSWYTDSALFIPWHFGLNFVTHDITLYAKWVEYKEPTELTINVTEPNTEVTINLTLEENSRTLVDFGNNTPIFEASTYGLNSFSTIYEQPGEYIIQTKTLEGNYYLGYNVTTPTINPISLLTNIKFSWDAARTGLGAFKDAVNLTTLTLTDYMSSVAAEAFENCSGLTSVTFPNNINSIDFGAFNGCTSLSGTLTLPKQLKVVDKYAFSNCSSLESIEFNAACSKIDDYAFSGCSALKNVLFPDAIEVIGMGAFQNCASLKGLDLGESIAEIGVDAFNVCSNIEYIILRNKDLVVGNRWLRGCSKITAVKPLTNLPRKSSTGEEEPEPGTLYYAWEEALPAFAFSAGMTGAGNNIDTIVFTDNLQSIGRYALAYTNCKEIILPNTLTEIGEGAFSDCLNLSTVHIPYATEQMQDNIFIRCSNLSSVYLYSTVSYHKIETPSQSWFHQCYRPDLKVYISRNIAIDALSTIFGSCWDCMGLGEDRVLIEANLLYENYPALSGGFSAGL